MTVWVSVHRLKMLSELVSKIQIIKGFLKMLYEAISNATQESINDFFILNRLHKLTKKTLAMISRI